MSPIPAPFASRPGEDPTQTIDAKLLRGDFQNTGSTGFVPANLNSIPEVMVPEWDNQFEVKKDERSVSYEKKINLPEIGECAIEVKLERRPNGYFDLRVGYRLPGRGPVDGGRIGGAPRMDLNTVLNEGVKNLEVARQDYDSKNGEIFAMEKTFQELADIDVIRQTIDEEGVRLILDTQYALLNQLSENRDEYQLLGEEDSNKTESEQKLQTPDRPVPPNKGELPPPPPPIEFPFQRPEYENPRKTWRMKMENKDPNTSVMKDFEVVVYPQENGRIRIDFRTHSSIGREWDDIHRQNLEFANLGEALAMLNGVLRTGIIPPTDAIGNQNAPFYFDNVYRQFVGIRDEAGRRAFVRYFLDADYDRDILSRGRGFNEFPVSEQERMLNNAINRYTITAYRAFRDMLVDIAGQVRESQRDYTQRGTPAYARTTQLNQPTQPLNPTPPRISRGSIPGGFRTGERPVDTTLHNQPTEPLNNELPEFTGLGEAGLDQPSTMETLDEQIAQTRREIAESTARIEEIRRRLDALETSDEESDENPVEQEGAPSTETTPAMEGLPQAVILVITALLQSSGRNPAEIAEALELVKKLQETQEKNKGTEEKSGVDKADSEATSPEKPLNFKVVDLSTKEKKTETPDKNGGAPESPTTPEVTPNVEGALEGYESFEQMRRDLEVLVNWLERKPTDDEPMRRWVLNTVRFGIENANIETGLINVPLFDGAGHSNGETEEGIPVDELFRQIEIALQLNQITPFERRGLDIINGRNENELSRDDFLALANLYNDNELVNDELRARIDELVEKLRKDHMPDEGTSEYVFQALYEERIIQILRGRAIFQLIQEGVIGQDNEENKKIQEIVDRLTKYTHAYVDVHPEYVNDENGFKERRKAHEAYLVRQDARRTGSDVDNWHKGVDILEKERKELRFTKEEADKPTQGEPKEESVAEDLVEEPDVRIIGESVEEKYEVEGQQFSVTVERLQRGENEFVSITIRDASGTVIAGGRERSIQITEVMTIEQLRAAIRRGDTAVLEALGLYSNRQHPVNIVFDAILRAFAQAFAQAGQNATEEGTPTSEGEAIESTKETNSEETQATLAELKAKLEGLNLPDSQKNLLLAMVLLLNPNGLNQAAPKTHETKTTTEKKKNTQEERDLLREELSEEEKKRQKLVELLEKLERTKAGQSQNEPSQEGQQEAVPGNIDDFMKQNLGTDDRLHTSAVLDFFHKQTLDIQSQNIIEINPEGWNYYDLQFLILLAGSRQYLTFVNVADNGNIAFVLIPATTPDLATDPLVRNYLDHTTFPGVLHPLDPNIAMTEISGHADNPMKDFSTAKEEYAKLTTKVEKNRVARVTGAVLQAIVPFMRLGRKRTEKMKSGGRYEGGDWKEALLAYTDDSFVYDSVQNMIRSNVDPANRIVTLESKITGINDIELVQNGGRSPEVIAARENLLRTSGFGTHYAENTRDEVSDRGFLRRMFRQTFSRGAVGVAGSAARTGAMIPMGAGFAAGNTAMMASAALFDLPFALGSAGQELREQNKRIEEYVYSAGELEERRLTQRLGGLGLINGGVFMGALAGEAAALALLPPGIGRVGYSAVRTLALAGLTAPIAERIARSNAGTSRERLARAIAPSILVSASAGVTAGRLMPLWEGIGKTIIHGIGDVFDGLGGGGAAAAGPGVKGTPGGFVHPSPGAGTPPPPPGGSTPPPGGLVPPPPGAILPPLTLPPGLSAPGNWPNEWKYIYEASLALKGLHDIDPAYFNGIEGLKGSPDQYDFMNIAARMLNSSGDYEHGILDGTKAINPMTFVEHFAKYLALNDDINDYVYGAPGLQGAYDTVGGALAKTGVF
jgi:hypothetical protein